MQVGAGAHVADCIVGINYEIDANAAVESRVVAKRADPRLTLRRPESANRGTERCCGGSRRARAGRKPRSAISRSVCSPRASDSGCCSRRGGICSVRRTRYRKRRLCKSPITVLREAGSGHAATNAQLRALAKARPLPIAAVPNRQFLARGVAPARASRQALRPHRRVGRHEGTGASSRPKLLPRSPGASRAPKATGRSIRLRVAAAAPRYRRSRVPEHAPVVPRPRTVSPKRPGLSAPPKRGKAQATAARAHAIVEPPLGYEVTPALLIAPGAERLDLGTAAVPTIAPRRRH